MALQLQAILSEAPYWPVQVEVLVPFWIYLWGSLLDADANNHLEEMMAKKMICEEEFEKWWNSLSGKTLIAVTQRELASFIWNLSWSTCGKMLVQEVFVSSAADIIQEKIKEKR